MSRGRGRSPGWAAFDLRQRQKQGLEPEFDNDPYPPMPNTINYVAPSKDLVMRNGQSARSFSSVLQPSIDFPTLGDNSDYKRKIEAGNSSKKVGNKVVEENNIPALVKLKEIHGWADDTLIKDILAAVNNDIHQASTSLKAMVCSASSVDNKERNLAQLSSTFEDYVPEQNNMQADEDVSIERTTDLAELSSVLEDYLDDEKTEQTDEDVSTRKKLFHGTAHAKLVLGLMSVPVEPEWVEDDVYLNHRKDAIRMIRLASQHSRAGTNAFLRGDHYSAQQLSVKAQEEWMGAEKLNAKAAKEILSIRNSKNDVWKLDLHGLHASEAVHALEEHLRKIESQLLVNRSVSPNRVKPKSGIVRSPSLESLSCMDMDEVDKQQALSRQRQTVLQVITGERLICFVSPTGTGNHSRGQAALPAVVRSFLIENGYRFDEARPGVIAVRPKFRHREGFTESGAPDNIISFVSKQRDVQYELQRFLDVEGDSLNAIPWAFCLACFANCRHSVSNTCLEENTFCFTMYLKSVNEAVVLKVLKSPYLYIVDDFP
ncbi:hypothetical protein HHK36_008906 [Tetracentron sinense]|uniref:Smr domain-containing protein n=1 Tax=Tetracentron sinense TaxID=13715 RepID=A0A834ZC44_TETSI|nr:hypothetical protein HHK36_008906 [Tetracentron sinense]